MKVAERTTMLAALLMVIVSMAAVGEVSAAVPPVKITRVFYDPPGTDTRTNTHLNLEYVVLTNTTTRTQTLSRWTLRDEQNHVYTFPTFSLGAGKSVTVHTGRGTATAAHRYYNSGNYIWNNTGDTAVLKNAAGATIATCRWTSRAAGGYKNC